MSHYKLLLDPGEFIGAADFPIEREVTISRIIKEDMPKRDGEKSSSAPMIYLKTKDGTEYPRKFKVPKSVLYGLSLHLGTDIDKWKDAKISVFAAKCMAFGDVEECLRVRFPADIEAKIYKWLKKRKAPAAAYMIRDSPQ